MWHTMNIIDECKDKISFCPKKENMKNPNKVTTFVHFCVFLIREESDSNFCNREGSFVYICLKYKYHLNIVTLKELIYEKFTICCHNNI